MTITCAYQNMTFLFKGTLWNAFCVSYFIYIQTYVMGTKHMIESYRCHLVTSPDAKCTSGACHPPLGMEFPGIFWILKERWENLLSESTIVEVGFPPVLILLISDSECLNRVRMCDKVFWFLRMFDISGGFTNFAHISSFTRLNHKRIERSSN